MSSSLSRVHVVVQGVPTRAGSIPRVGRGPKSSLAPVDSATIAERTSEFVAVAREPGETTTVERTRVEVAIIGAGVAGLEAARVLHEANVDIAILEARERIGGRVFTMHDPKLPMPIELGAEF